MAWYERVKFTLKGSLSPDGGKDGAAWNRCTNCGEVIYEKDFIENLKVCQHCGHHYRMSARERIEILSDEDSYEELWADLTGVDFLNFVDGKSSYAAKLESAANKTGLKDGMVTGKCKINGINVMLGVIDFSFLGGSMGSVMGEKISRAADYAEKNRVPLIINSCSGGARMHEGTTSLMQLSKVCTALARLHKVKVPYISILTDPTTGGASASFASLGDLLIGEPKAMIGFAGARVIEQTIKQKLPPGFQTAEFLLAHGFLDAVIPRNKMKDELTKILKWFLKDR